MQNNCSKKRTFLKSVCLLLLFLCFPINSIYAAYTSTWIAPATGTITTTGTNIYLAVNTGNDNFVGVDVTIEYTGQVEYEVASIVPNSKCANLDITNSPGASAGSISVMCVYTGSEMKYNGNVVVLKFKAKTTSGTSKFTITRAATGTHGASLIGANYTLGASTTVVVGNNNDSNTETGGMGGGSNLPQSGIFDNVSQKVIIGSSLILLGILFAALPVFLPKLSLFFKNTQKVVDESITTVIVKQKENSEKRRRGKLEKKF